MALFRMNHPAMFTLILTVVQLTVILSRQQKVNAIPIILELYNHETGYGDNRTMITSAAPDGNLTKPEFGRLITMSNILREGVDANSERIGTQSGFVAVGKDTLDVYISIVYHLNDVSGYNDSTIAVQGHIDARTFDGNHTFAVVGGTGKFLGFTGQDLAVAVPVAEYGSTSVHLHILTLWGPGRDSMDSD